MCQKSISLHAYDAVTDALAGVLYSELQYNTE